ncbi:ROK family protein [Nocardia sp. NPDC088792]|uniref:ROK family protein n=1 Tax=Nocardia sp. NPDC088792 TaxID=3364332 RepID=UPI0037FAB26C
MDHAPSGTPSDSAAVRRRNLGLVLSHIAAHGPCPRTDIATATGLAHGSVTALTTDLLDRGLIHEAEAPRSGTRGRPTRPLLLTPTRALTIAVQITAEHLRAAVADLSGNLLWRTEARHHSAPGTPEVMATAVAVIVRHAAAATLGLGSASAAAPVAGVPAGAGSVLVRVAIAMAGPVRDDVAQTVVVAPDFGWMEPVRLGELVVGLLPELGCPVDVVNDGNAAALAEYHARPGGGDAMGRGLVLVEAGTGIGGGVVLDGRIHTGGHGIAGEPGHIPVTLDGPPCVCGASGCLVLYAGPEAVLTAAGLSETLRNKGLEAASEELIAALRSADGRAIAAVERAGNALGVALLGIIALLDVDEVVLGGTLAQWFPWLAPAVNERLAGRRALAPALELEIVPAVLGEDAILLGAVEFARRTVISDPSAVPLLTVRR